MKPLPPPNLPVSKALSFRMRPYLEKDAEFLRSTNLVLGAVFLATLSVLPTARAADKFWSGGSGSSNNIDQGANWYGGVNPSSGDNLIFDNTITRHTANSNYAGGSFFGSLTTKNGAGGITWTGDTTYALKFENFSDPVLFSVNSNIGNRNISGDQDLELNPVGSGGLTINGTVTINGGKQIKVYGGNTLTLNNVVSGSGASFALLGGATVVMGAGNTYSGDTFINTGKLQFTSAGSANNSTIRIGDTSGTATAEMDLTATTGGQSFGNTIVSRPGGAGYGTRTLDSQNTSGTNALTGVIALDAALTIKQSAGGTLNLTGSFADVKQQVLTVNTAGTVDISKPLNSSFGAGGSLVKQGNGTLILSNTSNNYTGTSSATLNVNGTQIAAGTLAIAADTSLGIAPAGAYNNLQFTGTGTLRSDANISLHANRNISIAGGSTATFDTNGNSLGINGIISGSSGALTKSGLGTLTLFASNSYTGNTSVTGGTLLVNGSITGSGPVSVGVAGTLGGTGSIAGAVTVSGALSPGASIESLALSSSLTMNASSTLVYEASGAGSSGADLLVVGGTLSLTNVNLDLSSANLAGSWNLGDKITLISYNGSALTSGFNGYADDQPYNFGANSWLINYNDAAKGNNFALEATGAQFVTLTVVPEPTALFLGALGLLLVLRRRRIG